MTILMISISFAGLPREMELQDVIKEYARRNNVKAEDVVDNRETLAQVDIDIDTARLWQRDYVQNCVLCGAVLCCALCFAV